MRRLIRHCLSVFTLCATAIIGGFCHVAHAEENKHTVGWIEQVLILQWNVLLEAKIDTGAEHSSLHADTIEIFQKDGADWVRAVLKDKNQRTTTIERPLIRYTRIKQKQCDCEKQRPVIRLGLCMHNVYREVDVNLVDRSRFKQPMLIGRSYLADRFVVDVATTLSTTPNCRFKN